MATLLPPLRARYVTSSTRLTHPILTLLHSLLLSVVPLTELRVVTARAVVEHTHDHIQPLRSQMPPPQPLRRRCRLCAGVAVAVAFVPVLDEPHHLVAGVALYRRRVHRLPERRPQVRRLQRQVRRRRPDSAGGHPSSLQRLRRPRDAHRAEGEGAEVGDVHVVDDGAGAVQEEALCPGLVVALAEPPAAQVEGVREGLVRHVAAAGGADAVLRLTPQALDEVGAGFLGVVEEVSAEGGGGPLERLCVVLAVCRAAQLHELRHSASPNAVGQRAPVEVCGAQLADFVQLLAQGRVGQRDALQVGRQRRQAELHLQTTLAETETHEVEAAAEEFDDRRNQCALPVVRRVELQQRHCLHERLGRRHRLHLRELRVHRDASNVALQELA
eukprot:Rhum_TRINITY_DN13348_c0_g1::Rhum_TRINITY_DN13348_c0_g1_i1::g.59171::m.59171